MTDRIRLIVDTEDVIRRAVHLRKVKSGTADSISDLVNEILREALAEEIAELERHARPAASPKPGKKGKGKPEQEGGGK